MPSTQTIARLFVRFQNTFGHKFTSLFPDDASKALAMADWRHQLAGITDAEIERGFGKLGTRPGDKRDWPPGSLEFRQLCRPHREPYERPEFQARALPQLPADRSVAEVAIAKIRGRMVPAEEASDA